MPAAFAKASAPGKLILMGEHSAVYGAPAVVAAVGLRTRARAEPSESAGLVLELEDFGMREEIGWQSLRTYGDRKRQLWRVFDTEPSAENFAALSASEEAGVAKIACAETLKFLEHRERLSGAPPTRVTVTSELPVGSGLGSSASVAAAVVAALLSFWAEDVSGEDISTVALEVERRQHGRPSGIDHTAVLEGGVLAFTRAQGGLEFDELPWPGWLAKGVRAYDGGKPAESTGDVVAAVRDSRAQDRASFDEALEEMKKATEAFVGVFENAVEAWNPLLAAVRGFESCLEQLGVVPEGVADRIRDIEQAGGAAKISGAGALSGESAGTLLVFSRPDSSLDSTSLLAGYRLIDAALGVEGLTWSRS